MSLRLKIVAIVNKNTRSLSRLNWPELSLYYGCCNLSVGIYIQCIICMVKIVAFMIYTSVLIAAMFDKKWILNNVTVRITLYERNITLSEDDLTYLQDLLVSLITYYIVWIIMKFLHILAIVAVLYSIYCNKPRLLKAAVLTIFPNWIFDIVLMIGSKGLFSLILQTLFFIDACFDGYNILAMNSLYRQMARKSRIVPEEALNTQCITNQPTPIPYIDRSSYCAFCLNATHCEQRSEPFNAPGTSEDRDVTVSAVEEKVINFKDGPIIFDQAQLEGQNSMYENVSES